MTDQEKIESMLYELATPQKMGSFFVNNATSDFLFIRPSGNPISAKGFEEMIDFWRCNSGKSRNYKNS